MRASDVNADALEGVEPSPGGGRSESPSQPNDATAESGRSRAAYPPGEAEPLTDRGPWQSAAETVTESDCQRGGPGGGREDEPEQPASAPIRRKHLTVQMGEGQFQFIHELARASGMQQMQFLSAAVLLGACELLDRMYRVAERASAARLGKRRDGEQG